MKHLILSLFLIGVTIHLVGQGEPLYFPTGTEVNLTYKEHCTVQDKAGNALFEVDLKDVEEIIINDETNPGKTDQKN